MVSRGGRPDLAGGEALAAIRVPTLLIVGAEDPQTLQLNRAAKAILGQRAELAVIPGARHLFEEPGTPEQAAGRSSQWLLDTVSAASQPAARAQSAARIGRTVGSADRALDARTGSASVAVVGGRACAVEDDSVDRDVS